MKIIEKMIESLEEEIEGAKEYAERYIENKARGNIQRANTYKEMAHDELRHANLIHEFALQDLASIKHVYTLPAEEEERWEHAQKHAIDCMARVKHLLA